jgi:hypothetical protein
MPSGRTLAGEDLRRFGKLRDGMARNYAALSGNRKVAEAPPRARQNPLKPLSQAPHPRRPPRGAVRAWAKWENRVD